MAYQSKHTGSVIDNAVTEHSDINQDIIDINSQISQLNTLINNLNTSISNLQNKDILLESSINTLNTKIDNIDFQEPWTGSTILKSGTIAGSASFTYTATQNCICYISFFVQANSSGGIQVKVNNVLVVDMDQLGAFSQQLVLIPIYLQTGDTVYGWQRSNNTGKYVIMSMK